MEVRSTVREAYHLSFLHVGSRIISHSVVRLGERLHFDLIGPKQFLIVQFSAGRVLSCHYGPGP